MIKYNDLIRRTMPEEKKKNASKCLIGHYFVRPISNILSIPLIELHVSPTTITKISLIFPILTFFCFWITESSLGFICGWFSLLIWNILDGVDGNIARYNNSCTRLGELWDATVGWIACIVFYLGMGRMAFINSGLFVEELFSNEYYLLFGSICSLSWIFPRLVMQKKNVLFGEESIKQFKNRFAFGTGQLIFFNITSINGGAALIFLVCYYLNLNGICMIFYTLLSLSMCVSSLIKIFKNERD